jgi:hypothetical protein
MHLSSLSVAQKTRIRTVLQHCNRNLYTNLEDVDHPDRLYYDGHLTMDNLQAILTILRECHAEMRAHDREEA